LTFGRKEDYAQRVIFSPLPAKKLCSAALWKLLCDQRSHLITACFFTESFCISGKNIPEHFNLPFLSANVFVECL